MHADRERGVKCKCNQSAQLSSVLARLSIRILHIWDSTYSFQFYYIESLTSRSYWRSQNRCWLQFCCISLYEIEQQSRNYTKLQSLEWEWNSARGMYIRYGYAANIEQGSALIASTERPHPVEAAAQAPTPTYINSSSRPRQSCCEFGWIFLRYKTIKLS